MHMHDDAGSRRAQVIHAVSHRAHAHRRFHRRAQTHARGTRRGRRQVRRPQGPVPLPVGKKRYVRVRRPRGTQTTSDGATRTLRRARSRRTNRRTQTRKGTQGQKHLAVLPKQDVRQDRRAHRQRRQVQGGGGENGARRKERTRAQGRCGRQTPTAGEPRWTLRMDGRCAGQRRGGVLARSARRRGERSRRHPDVRTDGERLIRRRRRPRTTLEAPKVESAARVVVDEVPTAGERQEGCATPHHLRSRGIPTGKLAEHAEH
mmetsp:Transcript_7426/g.19188  ORF Transcript_7426/g.19188 Transcript_7426/m.19188 type:complete len:261 (-) Transcript_7426:587-1369(-)